MPWLVATAFLHSVMIQEKKNMLRVWNVGAHRARVRALDLRHLSDPERRPELDSQLHGVVDRPLVHRVPRARRGRLGGTDHLAAATSAVPDEARVARVARGGLPLQQPVPRCVGPDRSLGSRLSAGLGGGPGRGGDRRSALLQLFRSRFRTPGHPPDGHRTAGGVAAGIASLARRAARVACGRRARGGNDPRSWPVPDRARPASSATPSPPSP